MPTNQSPKDVIKAYLDKRAADDPLFAAAYAKPGKSIDECFRFIMGEARKQGSSVCMTDEEVFGLAVHYYDEDDIKVSPAPACRASVATPAAPKAVKLSKDEKEAAKAEALREYQARCVAEANKAIHKSVTKKQPAAETAAIPSLFDL